MSKILLTIHDVTGQEQFVQLQGKPATGVIKQIKSYGISHIYNEMPIPELGIYVHRIEN